MTIDTTHLRQLIADYREAKDREEPYYDLVLTEKRWKVLAVHLANSAEAIADELDALRRENERLEKLLTRIEKECKSRLDDRYTAPAAAIVLEFIDEARAAQAKGPTQ